MFNIFMIVICCFVLVCALFFIFGVKKKKKWFCIVSGIVGSLVLLVVILNYTVLYYSEDELRIVTSGEDNAEIFLINIDCRELSYEYTSEKFSTKYSLSELKKEIEKEYGDKIVLSADNSKIVITKNNNVITIKLLETDEYWIYNKYVYYARAEVIGMEKDEGEYVDIPFPKEYLNITGAYEKEMLITCDYDTLAGFYKDFTNVTYENEEIVIKQKDSVHIKIKDGKVFFEFE